jgi:hypothetical protein
MSTSRQVSGLRRSVLDGKSRKGAGKGAGWRGSWRDRFDTPKAEEEDILLTRAAYENPDDIDEKTGEARLAHFHTCQMHHLKLKPSGKGSFMTARCGLDAGKKDCLGCKCQAEGDRRITKKPDYSFNILHFGLYERVPLERDGKVVKHDDGESRGKPVLVWEAVEKPSDRKRILADLDGYIQDGTVRLYQKRYIEVGGGHRDDLAQIDADAAKFCRCGGDLTPVAFTCEQCEEELADVDKDDMGKKEVAAFAMSREKCKKCGHIGLPVPENTCNGCKKPEPLSAFDVVARVRKEGEGTNSHIVVKKITPLDQYQLPDGGFLIEFDKENGKYYPKEGEEGWVFVEDMDIRKQATSQWDFEKVHEPKDHDFLAKTLGVRNPFPPERGESKYSRYGGDTKEEGDDDKPRGRGGRDEPEEEEDRPRGRGGRGGRDEPEEEAPRRRRRE